MASPSTLSSVLAVVKKDLRIFFRRKTTTLLMILSPLVVILFFGVLFGSQNIGEKKLNVAVCDYDHSSLSNGYESSLKDFKLLNINDVSSMFSNEDDCLAYVRSQTLYGNYAFSLIIRKGMEKDLLAGNKQEVAAVFDNSKTNLVSLERYYVDAVNRQVSASASSAFISTAWAKLRTANSKVESLLEKMPSAMKSADNSSSQILEMKNKLQSFDVSVVSGSVDTIDSNLEYTQAELQQVKDTAGTTQQQLQQVSDGLGRFNGAFGVTAANLTLLLLQNQLQEGISNFQRINDEIDSATNSVQLTRNRIGSLKSLGSSLNDLDAKTLKQTSSLEQGLKVIKSDLKELQNNLQQTHNELNAMTAEDPSTIISPINLSEEDSFQGNNQINFVIYGVIGIVIMLSALLISSTVFIKERTSAAYQSTLLTPSGVFPQLLGKLISCSFIMLLQVMVILGISVFFLGVQYNHLELLLPIMLLISSSFILLGIMLGSLTHSENSAILASIAVSIPAIFISGLLVPYEFMPPAIQLLSDYFPSTIGINAMKEISLHQNIATGFSYSFLLVLELLVLFLANLFIIKFSRIKIVYLTH